MAVPGSVYNVGIAGFGTIGMAVGRRLQAGLDGMRLAAVTSGREEKAKQGLASIGSEAPVLSPAALADACDIIVECAPTAAFLSIAEPAMDAGRQMVTVSAAALIENMEIVDRARANGGRIIMATGALLGLDAVRAAALGEIHSVTMITRKPPRSLKGAPHLDQIGVDVMALDAPMLLFDGSAREGARGFPANVNVAAALALAGVGPDRTRLQIWADPGLERNTHTIRVEADSAAFEMFIQNVPSPEKPGTGKITALSMIAALQGLVSPLKVGS
jgi:aspartate dehydrogenase